MNSRQKAYTDRLLHAWAQWVRDGRTWPNTLGYPQATVEARLMADGAGAADQPTGKSKVPTVTRWDREIVTVDRVIGRMSAEMRSVVYARYVNQASCRELALVLGVSHTVASRRCGEAFAYIAGAMG